MKKSISLILSIVIIASIASICSGCNKSNTVDVYSIFKYEDIGKSITITGKNETLPSTIIIPDEIAGKPVTKIAAEAFRNCNELVSVTLGKNIETVGESAFIDCKSLVNFYFSEKMDTIPQGMFYYCEALEEITIPENIIIIENGAFFGCRTLTRINIHSSVKYIVGSAFKDTAFYRDESNWENGALYIKNYLIDYSNYSEEHFIVKTGTTLIAESAFEGNSRIKSVTLPESIKYICDDAFCSCYCLETINFPYGLEEIGNSAFSYTNLLGVNLPDSVNHVGCFSFTSTKDYNNKENWESGAFYLGHILVEAAEFLPDNFNIKPGTILIADYAFSKTKYAKNIYIPASLKICTELPRSEYGLKDIYFGGSAEQFNKLYGNELPQDVSFHYNSQPLN